MLAVVHDVFREWALYPQVALWREDAFWASLPAAPCIPLAHGLFWALASAGRINPARPILAAAAILCLGDLLSILLWLNIRALGFESGKWVGYWDWWGCWLPAILLCGNLDDGTPAPWPPSRESQTGVGLNWYPMSPHWNRADDAVGDGSPGHPRPSHQLAIKSTIIPEPSGTILLTERIHVENIMMFANRQDIPDTTDHVGSGSASVYAPPYFYPSPKNHHSGRFQYLMIDSHVESLPPNKTTSDPGLRRGMWSIKAGD